MPGLRRFLPVPKGAPDAKHFDVKRNDNEKNKPQGAGELNNMMKMMKMMTIRLK